MVGEDRRMQSKQCHHCNDSSDNEREEVEDYNQMMEHLLQSTSAEYSTQVDRTKHLVFGSKVIQETSLYASSIRRWYLGYKASHKRDKRRIARRVVRELVEAGCRFYQPSGDKKYSHILLSVQHVEKIEMRIIRDLQSMVRSEGMPSDAPEESEESVPEIQTYQHYQERPPVPHVDIPKISRRSSGEAYVVDAAEVDDVSSIHAVSIDVGTVSQSSSSLGYLQGHANEPEQKEQVDTGDPTSGEHELLDPCAPPELNRLESWSRRQLQAPEVNEERIEEKKLVTEGNSSKPAVTQYKGTLGVAGGGSTNDGEACADSTGKPTLEAASMPAQSNEVSENQDITHLNSMVPSSLKRAPAPRLAEPSFLRRSCSSLTGGGVMPLLPRPTPKEMATAREVLFQDLPMNGHWKHPEGPVVSIAARGADATPGESSLFTPSYTSLRRQGPGQQTLDSGGTSSSRKEVSRPNEERATSGPHQKHESALEADDINLFSPSYTSPGGLGVVPPNIDSGRGNGFRKRVSRAKEEHALSGPQQQHDSNAKMPLPRPSKRVCRGRSAPSKLKSPSFSRGSEIPNGNRNGAKKASSLLGLVDLATARMDSNCNVSREFVGEMSARLQAIEKRLEVMESQNRRLKQRLVDLEEEEDRRGEVVVHHASSLAATYAMPSGGSGSNERPVNGERGETADVLGIELMPW